MCFTGADTYMLEPWVCQLFQAVASLWKVTASFFLLPAAAGTLLR